MTASTSIFEIIVNVSALLLTIVFLYILLRIMRKKTPHKKSLWGRLYDREIR